MLQFDLQRGIQLPVESANEKLCKWINQTSRFKTQSTCQQNLSSTAAKYHEVVINIYVILTNVILTQKDFVK